MSAKPPAERCPTCGTPLPAGVRADFCPVCVLREAMPPARGGEAPYLPESMGRLGDYDLLGEIARGGMGVVFRARQRSLGRVVALKLMLGGQFATPEAQSRFRREAAAAARIQHPNIVAIHEIGEHDGQPYFSMDYIEGETLGDRVRGGPLAPRDAARYAARIAGAVHHAHQQGVLHRDLKPSNVLIDLFDEPRVTDFGLAKQLHGSATLTATGEVLGSPAYAAPEQVRGEAARVGLATDVYALGALLYHLLTGRPPFQGGTLQSILRQVCDDEPVPPRRLNPSVPADLETVCLKCLEKDPLRRYPTAGAVADELDRFLAGEPVRVRPLRWPGRTARWARRRPAVAGLLGALMAAMAALVVLGLVAGWRILRAEEAAVANLRDSLLVQARAVRLAGGPGQQQASLDAIGQALALDAPGVVRGDAVREVVAALAQTDLVFEPVEGVDASGRLRPAGAGDRWRRLAPDGMLEDLTFPGGAGPGALGSLPAGAARLGESTPSGRRQVVVDAEALTVWDFSGGAPVRVAEISPPPGHHALSPDGRWLVTAGDGPELGWRDLETGAEHRVDSGQAGWRWLGFSPDGLHLAASRVYANSVDLYDAGTRALGVRFPQPGPAEKVVWAPTGDRFVAATIDGRLFYQDVPGRSRILSFTFAPARPMALAFDASGRFLASAWDDRTIRLWDLHGGRLLASAPGDADALAFGHDGARFGPVAHQGRTGWYRVIPAVGFTEILAGYLGSSELQVGFSPDGRRIAGRYQYGVRVYDPVSRDLIATVPTEFPRGFEFPAEGDGIGVLDRLGLGVWPWGETSGVGSRRAVLADAGHSAVAGAAAGGGWWLVGPGGDVVPVGTEGHPGRSVGRHPGADGLAVDPGGRWVVSVESEAGTVRAWSADGAGEVHQVAAGPRAGARFDPTGRRLAVWGEAFRLLEAGSWRILGVPVPAPQPVLGAAAFSPDGRRLAMVADVYDILLVDLAGGGRPVWIEPPSRLRILSLAWSPDGRRLAAATAQGKLRIWDLPVLESELARRGLPGRLRGGE